MKVSTVALVAAAALALSGCVSLTGGGGGGPSGLTANATGSIATSGNPLTSGTVTNSGTSLSITLDGTTYNLPIRTATGTSIQNGRTYTNSSYTDSTTAPTVMGGVTSLQYASLISLGKVASWNPATSTGTVGKFEVLATGTVVTPTGSLPAQIVQYDGQYALALGSTAPTAMAGTFTATADFNAGTVAIASSDNLLNSLATIQGSTFTATLSHDDAVATVNGKLAGGFYGPSAEEIAGVAGGTITYKSGPIGTTDFSAGFLGGKSP